ncbi:multicomponent Na+:H+ antiporter subunit E [Devosia enhydra]|uniref:Multicomponent Na+:H+ antiporter subunit E n=1 Tax=Devosia enhydra TaxID=665118 RepID=A0A1K2I0Q8_9HYPH|nr:Na+/H+ antiporter subunit E [Devosia enhydra]SFZ85904.1 multicomponent Na+:H+ antiporter subunit E [Devosia enhydra]
MMLRALKIFVIRLPAILALAWLFVRELVISAAKVAWLVMQPDLMNRIRPAFVAIPLSPQSDASITMLANLITLTPGTLSVDVSEDRSLLFIHVMTMGNKEDLVAEIASGFEARVKAVFQ